MLRALSIPLALGLGLALTLALARPAPARAQSDDAPPEYQALVDGAVAEFSAGRWPEARALFQRAHASFPNARTLRGIGMSSFEMRDYPEAVRALEAALASEVRALTPEQRTQVEALLARARTLVGRFRLAPAPAGSRLYVDGAGASAGDAWPEAEGVLVLAVGRHEVSVRADGRTAHATIDVRGGEDAVLDIDLSDLLPPPATSAARTQLSGSGAAPRRPARPEPADDTPAWVLVGVGSGAAVLGAVLLGVGLGDSALVENAGRGTEWASLSDAYSRTVPLQVTGGVLIGAGLTAALVGLVWAAVNDGDTPAHERIGLRLDVGVGSLSLEGTF